MLSFFRRLVHSRVGVLVTLVFLGLIALAFAAGDVSGITGGQAVAGNQVAKIGGTAIGEAELMRRAQTDLQNARREAPELTIAQYINGGGLEATLERIVNATALSEWGEKTGMRVGKRAVDGAIASQPGLQGPDGKFSQALYERVLRENRLSVQQLRDDVARDIVSRQLVAPTAGASQVANQLAIPYASLLLERRQGSIGFIPATATKPAAPSAAEVDQFYKANVQRYTLPERRIMKFSAVTPETVAANTTPSAAEIQAAYTAAADRYGAKETRNVEQVIVLDQAGAAKLAAAVRGGATLAAAARGAGLEPSTFTAVTKETLATQTAQSVADAAFAAADGAVAGPVRSPLGFHVLRVSGITASAQKPLESVRAEVEAEVRQRKQAEALSALHDGIDASIVDGATFDEIAAERRLRAGPTPPLTAAGRLPGGDPRQPGPVPMPIVQAGFGMGEGDEPQLVSLDDKGSFALVALERVLPPSPIPFAEVRARVAADLTAQRGAAAAKTVAERVAQAVSRGTPLAQALAGTGLTLPKVEAVDTTRAQIARVGQRVPPPLALMFAMAPGRAKPLAAPRNEGWYVVALNRIESRDASKVPGAVTAIRREIGGLVGREYAEQFVRAIRRDLGETRNQSAINAARQNLLSGAPAPQ